MLTPGLGSCSDIGNPPCGGEVVAGLEERVRKRHIRQSETKHTSANEKKGGERRY